MNSCPFLTIGIASYNYARYLRLAFFHICNQSFTDYEILYCDDGSTDESLQIIQDIILNNPDKEIRVVSGKNEGILANKNRIVDNARGKYLMICDADDYMLDGCLEALCGVAKQDNADCVIGGFDEVDGNGGLLKRHVPPQNASKWLYIWHHIQIYKTSILKEHNIRFNRLPDDVCYLQDVHYYSKTCCFVTKSLFAKVRHSDSTSVDFKHNPDWHPQHVWHLVAQYIGELLQRPETRAEKDAISFFLYKWFYFNVADLPSADNCVTRRSICEMQSDMEQVCPGHLHIHKLALALKTPDTEFAKVAVFGCWCLEKIGLLRLIVTMRTWQRKQQNKHEVSKWFAH